MVSLVDILPQTRTVQIAAGELELRGLSLRHIGDLLVRFPELRKLITPGAPDLDPGRLIELAPEAIGTIIAYAAGQPEAAGNVMDVLSMDDVMEILVHVRELTMPSGAPPFLAKLERLISGPVALRLGRDQDTPSEPQPSS